MKRGKISVISRFKMLNVLCIFVGVLVFAAPLTSTAAGNDSGIDVMTRNLYLGADIFRVVDAATNPPNPALHGLDIPVAVAQVYKIMLETNFWARAEAIADEIAAKKPQVIGLNEVETFSIQTPSDFFYREQE